MTENRGMQASSRDLFLFGFIYTGVLLGHMIVLQNVLQDMNGVYIFPDSEAYYKGSLFPPSPPPPIGFAFSHKPPGAVLFYKLLGSCDYAGRSSYFICEDFSLLYGQIATSLAAFSFLAFAFAKVARTKKGRFALFMFPLLFSFTPLVTGWNFVALSESFNISLFAVFVAGWIRFLQTKRLSWLVMVGIVALLWGMMRDTNAYVLVMIVLVIVGALFRPCNLEKVPMMALCVWFVCIFTVSDFSANAGSRWVVPFFNNIAQRILPVPERVAYFSDHGMPVSPELLKLSGKKWYSENYAFHTDPRLKNFRTWAHEHGKKTYIKYLVTYFTNSMADPLSETVDNFAMFAFAGRPDYVSFLGSLWNPWRPSRGFALCYILIVYGLTVCYAFVSWRRKWLLRCPYLAVPVIMILLAAPHAWLTWHGDAMETGRHALLAFIQFQLGFMLLLIFVWDHGTSRTRSVVQWTCRKSKLSPPQPDEPDIKQTVDRLRARSWSLCHG